MTVKFSFSFSSFFSNLTFLNLPKAKPMFKKDIITKVQNEKKTHDRSKGAKCREITE